ncbi:MAG: sigma-70 family RNA polymerase sigma factor [Actinomycetota bacterium]
MTEGATPDAAEHRASRSSTRRVALRVPRIGWLLRVPFVGAPSSVSANSARSSASSDGLTFDGFYRAQYPAVTRLAFSLCGSMPVAEELAQEAFVAAHRRWNRLVRYDRPDLWVRRVVINRSISYRRRQTTERRALETLSSRPVAEDAPVLTDHDLWAALRSLSARQAEVLALVYVEDRPIADVAEILGLGDETVRTHLKRGRSALAALLGDADDDPDDDPSAVNGSDVRRASARAERGAS